VKAAEEERAGAGSWEAGQLGSWEAGQLGSWEALHTNICHTLSSTLQVHAFQSYLQPSGSGSSISGQYGSGSRSCTQVFNTEILMK